MFQKFIGVKKRDGVQSYKTKIEYSSIVREQLVTKFGDNRTRTVMQAMINEKDMVYKSTIIPQIKR